MPAHIGLLLPGMQCVNVGINKAEVGRQFRSFDGSLECLDASFSHINNNNVIVVTLCFTSH